MVPFKINIRIILIPLFVLLVFNSKGQIIKGDTTQIVKSEKTLEEIHSPKKATLYSALLPGLGQVYNKKWWKVPFIYGGFGAIVYFMDWNNDNYQINRLAYIDLTDGDDATNYHVSIASEYHYNLDDPTSTANFKTALTKRQDYYRRNRDLLFIGMLGFYGLNIIDAGVDAHLFNFDISDDLTFNWQPSMLNINNEYVYCVNCTFKF